MTPTEREKRFEMLCGAHAGELADLVLRLEDELDSKNKENPMDRSAASKAARLEEPITQSRCYQPPPPHQHSEACDYWCRQCAKCGSEELRVIECKVTSIESGYGVEIEPNGFSFRDRPFDTDELIVRCGGCGEQSNWNDCPLVMEDALAAAGPPPTPEEISIFEHAAHLGESDANTDGD